MRLRRAALCLALASLAPLASVPAASAATSPTVKKRPTITRVTPMRVKVGAVMTIRGRNFSSRRTRNTVIFRAPDGRSAFVKPRRATSRKLVIVVPAAAGRILGDKVTRFKLRVLAGRFGAFTPKRLSPVLVPSGARSTLPTPGKAPAPVTPGPGSTVTPPPTPPPTCTAGDFDGDLLSGATEAAIKTDPCRRDTDGDGVEDGYEYQSAIDLNYYPATPPLPYPGSRPYPNALDPSDAVTDYDGDGLRLGEEHFLWLRYSGDGAPRSGRPTTLAGLLYSDGLQKSLSPPPPAPAPVLLNWVLDADEDGELTDDERDGDGDGLGNWDEQRGRFTESWWVIEHNGKLQPKESRYPAIDFLDNEDLLDGDALANPDIDGDGVTDGADDHDRDGLSNQFEVRRPDAWLTQAFAPGTNPWAYTQPFNPCKPFNSERCHRYFPPGYYDDDEVPPIGPDTPGGYPGSQPVTPNG